VLNTSVVYIQVAREVLEDLSKDMNQRQYYAYIRLRLGCAELALGQVHEAERSMLSASRTLEDEDRVSTLPGPLLAETVFYVSLLQQRASSSVDEIAELGSRMAVVSSA
jgi:hypothetical protein